MPPINAPLIGSKFTLNTAGVAGFFGGEEAISAMATVHLYSGRRWLGWYNSPGSYTIAKRFGRMANSRFWDGLFPGPNDSPAVSFELDGKQGPDYIAALSGTTMRTGHLAYLTMGLSKDTKPVDIEGRRTKPAGVSYLAMKEVDYETPVKRLPIKDALFGIIPITTSLVASIMCGLVHDWFSFSMIILGMISSGWASLVIGQGELVIKSIKNPAKGAPSGHGVLLTGDEVVVIKGKERDVNAITKGRFELRTDMKHKDEELAEESYHAIGICSLLLIVQFLVQLLLIPQGTLFGQILFLVTLGVSWGYNSYLSSLEQEKIQTELLFETLAIPEMLRFRVWTRTTMAVFVCLLVFHKVEASASPEQERKRREKILHSCVPHDTDVWRRWTTKVVDQLMNIDYRSQLLPYLTQDEDQDLGESDRTLLGVLLGDAASAFKGYLVMYEKLPDDSSHEMVKAQ